MTKYIMRSLLATALASALFASSAAARYTTRAVDDGGTLEGAVTFTGPVPAQSTALIGKDNAVCGEGEIIPNPVALGDGGALENVVVFLEEVKAGKAWPEREYVLDQHKCSFEPYLQVVPNGVELTIRNSDSVLHNVHPFEIIGNARRTLFNLAQPKLDQVNRKTIKTRRGNVVELACDAHSWMAGWLYVLEHPYFDVAGASGTFSIDNIPPGKYTLVAWHPVLGRSEQAVEVGAGEITEANFQFEGE